MIKNLETSALPLYVNQDNGKLLFEAPLTYGSYSEKPLTKMNGLFEDIRQNNPQEIVYEVYRDIIDPKDRGLFDKFGYRYDITVIKDGHVGKERKKTSGHYHGYNPQRTYTYAEIYEVLQGTACFILQKFKPCEKLAVEDLFIEEIKLMVAKAGEAIVIPPFCAHCSINIGEGDLIFDNLTYTGYTIDYEPVKYYHGLTYYIDTDKEGNLVLHKNPHYKNVPKAVIKTYEECPTLGIQKNHPIYAQFVVHPEQFIFLGDVDPYVETIAELYK